MYETHLYGQFRVRDNMIQVLICFFLAFVFVGCQVPDLTGFSTSAITVRSSVGEAESIYRPFVERYHSVLLAEFDSNWENVKAATDALVDYAQSLEAIAAAGTKGAEGARQLAASVDKLANRFNTAGLVASAGADIFAEVYGAAASSVAALTLADTTEKAQPLIKEICEILADSIADNLADDIPVIYVQIKNEIDDKYPDVAGQYEILVRKRATLLGQLVGAEPAEWPDTVVQDLEKLDAIIARL